MKTKKPSLLYRLFDSNIYGKLSQCTLFFGALTIVAGQFLAAGVLIGVGVASLGGSIYKNISDEKQAKEIRKQLESEAICEDYIPENTTKKENTTTKSQSNENHTYSTKDNSNERV